MSNYNPFISAFQALTCEEAVEFYRDRACQDIGLIIWVVGIAAEAAYRLGAAVGEVHFQAVADAQPRPKALPPAKADAGMPAIVYSSLTKVDLLQACADKGLKVSKRLHKAQLIELLTA